MIANQISKVLRLAINTFAPAKSQAVPDLFQDNFNQLKKCLDQTSAADIALHEKYMTKEFWEDTSRAPIRYIHIYEDRAVTIGVFIMGPGTKMPLHDHPHMFGLLKVIAGQVRIQSYTIVDEQDYATIPISPAELTVTAQKNPVVTVNCQSDSCVLQPKRSNLHEIICEPDGAAAFIDVLSPPYDTSISVGEYRVPRKCRYFEHAQTITEDLEKLKEIKAPSSFWTSQEKYLGPIVGDSDVSSHETL